MQDSPHSPLSLREVAHRQSCSLVAWRRIAELTVSTLGVRLAVLLRGCETSCLHQRAAETATREALEVLKTTRLALVVAVRGVSVSYEKQAK